MNLENGLYTSSEILSRSGFEHAVNLLLIINDECYLKSFVLDYHKTKIKSADFWKLYAQKQGNTNLEIAAENRIEQLRLSLNILSIQDSDSKKLPKIYERFEKIGMEAAYHNLYAPSCDAVHALMEDVANFLIATKIKTKDKQNLNVAEKKSYAIYMSINSVQFYYKTLYAYMVFYNVIDIYMLKMEDVNQQLTALLSIHENDNLDLI